MENDIPVDPQKVRDVVNYLTNYLLTLPEYNNIRAQVQESVMGLYDLQSRKTMNQEERQKYNNLLEQAEAPEYLMF